MQLTGNGLRARAYSLALIFAGLVSTAAQALPTVSLTAPANGATFGRPAQVTISANATPTAGSSITKVEFYRGGSTLIATVNAPGPYTTVWNHNTAGTYSITAKAFDSTGNTTSAARSITINNNATPTVSLTSPSNGDLYGTADEVFFSATASDSNGTVASVEFFSGSTSLGIDTTAPYELSLTLPVGAHSITARATDNQGGFRNSTPPRNIQVRMAPSVSVASPANGASFADGTPIEITANASTGAPEQIVAVYFYAGAEHIGTATSPAPFTVTWAAPSIGVHSITASAEDSLGMYGDSTPISVTVTAPRAAPTISFTSPTSGSLHQSPASISLAATATATEPGATITKVEFFEDETLLATDTSAPYAHAMSGLATGGYLLKAKATDSFGTTATALAYVAVDGADSCDASPPLTSLSTETKLAAFGQLPHSFEPNVGQLDDKARFVSRGRGYQVFLGPTESVVTLHDAKTKDGLAVRMRFLGANKHAKIAGAEPLARKSHYLVGSNPAQWRRNVPNFAKVRYHEIYPGIDKVYYGSGGRLEYDLVVAPGANPSQARFSIEGADKLAIDALGNLVLNTARGDLIQQRPVAYQEIEGERKPVAAAYRLADNQVEFDIGAYDRSRELIIDPVLVYSTYLGGSDDQSAATSIALSRCGEAHVAGWTYATNFPTTPGAFDQLSVPGTMLGFVSKLNQAGSALLYSTYITGTERDDGNGYPQESKVTAIQVDATGHAYVGGETTATDFPITPGAYVTTPEWFPRGFVAKLTSDGSALIYSTYHTDRLTALAIGNGNAYVGGGFGIVWKLNTTGTGIDYEFTVGGSGAGGSYDRVNGIYVDASGNAYVAGTTYSTNLPVTTGAFQVTKPNAGGGVKPTGFVSKVNPAGSALVWGTYFGTSGLFYLNDLAVDSAGNVYVTGSADTSALIPGLPSNTMVTLAENSIATGTWFGLTAKLNASGNQLVYATRFGGSRCDSMFCSAATTSSNAIALDGSGNAWMFGTTATNQMPLVKPLYSQFADLEKTPDFFAVKLNTAGSGFVFSTVLNGTEIGTTGEHGPGASTAADIAVDSIGSAYMVGSTNKTNFPTTPGSYRQSLPGNIVTNAFVTKINETKDTTTTLAIAPTEGAVGSASTLTATVTGNAPTGNVAFKDSGNTIGTAAISGTTAQLVTSTLQPGVRTLSAAFEGDAHNNPSASQATLYNVRDPTTGPTITMTGIADGASLAAGAGGYYTGGAMTVTATPATGNKIVDVTVRHPGGTHYTWAMSPSETFNESWPMHPFAQGSHFVFARAVDNNGLAKDSAPIRFTVNAVGANPPTVALAAPTPGATFIAPEAVTLTATASATSPKSVAAVEFYRGSTLLGTVNTQPYTFAWTNTLPGTHSLIARAVDSAGAQTFSVPISITIGPPQPPTVQLTAPTSGATFTSPGSIAMTATASGAAGATIAQVEFLSGTTVVGTSTTAPFSATWSSVPPGSYSLSARATDSRGSNTTSSAVPFEVVAPPPPLISVSSPTTGATFVAPASIAITASATPASGAAITQVEFLNGGSVIGVATTAPYTFTWTSVQEGSYSLTARATDDRLAQATSSAVNVSVTAAASLQIAAAPGLDGSSTSESTVLIRGSVTAPINSGVTVNGILAALGANGDFSVNEVPLALGANSIVLTVTTKDGEVASQTIAINRSGTPSGFSVSIEEPEGTAPHKALFTLEAGGATPVATVDFDFDDNGTIDYTASGVPSAGITATYPNSGTFRARVIFKNSGGAVLFSTTKQIHVLSAVEQAAIAKSAYLDLVERLQSGSSGLALKLVLGSSRQQYAEVFDRLGADLAQAANQLGTIESITMIRGGAELALKRGTGPNQETFLINLIRGGDGIWRIESM